eukprot:100263-Alexandrium_andersonii.AAC.1
MLQGKGVGWARTVSRRWRRRSRSVFARSGRGGKGHWYVRRLAWLDGSLASRRQGGAPGPRGG